MSYIDLLNKKEVNPAVVTAIKYLDSLSLFRLQEWKRHLAKLENNNVAYKCIETIDNLLQAKQVTEMDIISLAWTLRFDLYETITKMEIAEVKKRKEERDKK